MLYIFNHLKIFYIVYNFERLLSIYRILAVFTMLYKTCILVALHPIVCTSHSPVYDAPRATLVITGFFVSVSVLLLCPVVSLLRFLDPTYRW